MYSRSLGGGERVYIENPEKNIHFAPTYNVANKWPPGHY